MQTLQMEGKALKDRWRQLTATCWCNGFLSAQCTKETIVKNSLANRSVPKLVGTLQRSVHHASLAKTKCFGKSWKTRQQVTLDLHDRHIPTHMMTFDVWMSAHKLSIFKAAILRISLLGRLLRRKQGNTLRHDCSTDRDFGHFRSSAKLFILLNLWQNRKN